MFTSVYCGNVDGLELFETKNFMLKVKTKDLIEDEQLYVDYLNVETKEKGKIRIPFSIDSGKYLLDLKDKKLKGELQLALNEHKGFKFKNKNETHEE